MCWRNQREVAPKVCLSLLFLLSLYISSHMYYQKNHLVPWFLSLISGLGTPPKWKNKYHSSSPVPAVSQTLCTGVDRSSKITWKLWLPQPPVHLILILFPFPFEFWVRQKKGGNPGEGLEAAILGHSFSGVYMIHNMSFYTRFQFNQLPWF